VITIPKIKDLVAIAGRVNHPHIKEASEINEMELKVKLMKVQNDIEKEEILTMDKITHIKNPLRISVPFHKQKRANYYVKKYAGGIDRENGGRKKLIFVRYANGAVKKTKGFLFFKCYPKVDKGAMVYVDTHTKNKKIREARRPVDWNIVIKDSFAILTSGLTVYALLRAVITP
jgi:hypothetical protein